MRRSLLVLAGLPFLLTHSDRRPLLGSELVNTWTLVSQDPQGARRYSSFRWINEGGYFLLWGFMGHVTDQYGNPEQAWNGNNEYDIVVFDPNKEKWESQYPYEKVKEWGLHPPPMHLCSSYQGITTGSYRPQLRVREGVLRPDLNIAFDQVTYDTRRSRMIYFTGGRTFAYETRKRQWSDAAPNSVAPPPVSGATLCYDPFHDAIVLAGGGHVAEPGPGGKLVGYTGTWIFDCRSARWQPLGQATEPPPRMSTRLVCDIQNRVMVMFGGDGQSRYLADTWIYDLATRRWRQSQASGGPPARAGHFTVFDPGSGWVIIGGGYNRKNLSDMWAYDARTDRWTKLKGEVPTGWYITADIDPRKSLIVLTTSTKTPGDTMHCNEIYPVRTTYMMKVRKGDLVDSSVVPRPQKPVLKRSMEEAMAGTAPDEKRRRAQLMRIRTMPVNRWVLFSNPGRVAPLRTWGSCSFDTNKGRLVYWGGGHCGYGGNDYDFYDVEENTWISSPIVAEYPERAWDLGVNAAGVTFSGAPFIRHGRKIYAYDPVSKLIINMKTILLTAGYEPGPLKTVKPVNPNFGSGENFTQSHYTKWVTWAYDPDRHHWEVVCSATPGLDLTVTTPHGVLAVKYWWDVAGRKDRPDAVVFQGRTVIDNSVYRLDVKKRRWEKLNSSGPWPQNLYELTALVYDSRRDRLILHGGGLRRDELWRFPLREKRWEKIEPQFAPDMGGTPPVCRREAVYIPDDDVMLTAGQPANSTEPVSLYAYHVGRNRWYKLHIPPPDGKRPVDLGGQNRAWTFDPKHNLVLMVLGDRGGDQARAQVFALRYHHSRALRKQ